VACGEQAVGVYSLGTHAFRDAAPDGRRIRQEVFKDCGHVPQEEKSELFSKVVADFLDDR